ncbi:MAG: PEP-CTERM sorting domain-containing protein [Desulfobacteraceae bacterium]|nr:PEP-CTERM sorting domain-containing protein [Desulfobacteraceae bacterium]MBU4053941.1 PEP-CTERM sorting domain-containing protein [Pseudomonadota bacterium]
MRKLKLYRLFFVGLFLLLFSSTSSYAVPVYPDSGLWENDTKNNTTQPIISTDKPRSGNASLKLTTSAAYVDWSFYVRETDAGLGYLKAITSLSFDWLLPSSVSKLKDSAGNEIIYDPWYVQTPVLRLLIKDGDYFSELVWERYYTDSRIDTMTDDIGIWQSENLMDQNFWHHTITDEGYTLNDGTSANPYLHQAPLMALTTNQWANKSGITLPYSLDSAVVYGISVGVGSAWPGAYTAYVDNIYLAFANGSPVINDNFELPVPEPATLLLLGSGLAMLGARRKWRSKSSRS